MEAAAALVALALPLAFAAGTAERAVQPASTFPEIAIRKGEIQHEWPFSVEEGRLACVDFQGQRIVIFSEPWREDVPQEFGNMTLPRSVIVSANPLALLASLEDRSLYLPFDGLETLIRRLAPFERIGAELCEADAGTQDKKI